METVTLKVQGMTCMGCVKSVGNVLRAIPGVAGVDVSLEEGKAAIRYDPAQSGADAFKKAIEDAGYEAA